MNNLSNFLKPYHRDAGLELLRAGNWTIQLVKDGRVLKTFPRDELIDRIWYAADQVVEEVKSGVSFEKVI